MTLDDIDPAAVVLRPQLDTVVGYGRRGLALSTRWARYAGDTDKLARFTIEPHYKPVRWTVAGGVMLGSSAGDVAWRHACRAVPA